MSTINSTNYKSPSAPHWAVALLKYRPKCDDELCLTDGQVIHVLSVNPKDSGSEGWWVGQDLEGRIGVFPANYVRLQDNDCETEDGTARNNRNSSEGQGSSLQDSASSFTLEGTSRIPTQPLIGDSALGTGVESDGEFRFCRKIDGSRAGIGALRVIKYEDIILGESIGAGSFGTVYQGTWEKMTVALKVFHQASSQIQREALNLGQLCHRNVVKFYGLWERSIQSQDAALAPALVMEFARGGALHTLVRSRPSVHCSTLADWALQIAEGMRYLHEQARLVHRDLKTANILIREPLVENPGPEDLVNKTLIISDFGMSCSAGSTGLRVSGVGTAAYAAPEVICMELFTLTSDVWSYGVVLWEIFTMQEPFGGFDRAQQLVNIGRHRQKLYIPRPEAGFPASIGSLLMRCWSDEWSERPSFSDIQEYLMEVQNDPFFSLPTQEFVQFQDSWIMEICNDPDSSLVSDSCSSEASSPLRRQNEFLQQENAKMRDALLALQENAVRDHCTIAGLQKDNQILSVLAANMLYNKTPLVAPPAPRKRPFFPNLFRRNEQKNTSTSSAVSSTPINLSVSPSSEVDGHVFLATSGSVSGATAERTSPAVKCTGKKHGTASKSSIDISYPSAVRHVVHVPVNFDMHLPMYRSNFSPGSYNAFTAVSPPGGTLDISSSQTGATTTPPQDLATQLSSLIFSPMDDEATTTYISRQFAFLDIAGTPNNALLPPQAPPKDGHRRSAPKVTPPSGVSAGNGPGLISYKSAPELCEQMLCVPAVTIDGSHTVSRGSAFDATTNTSTAAAAASAIDRKPVNTSSASRGVPLSKRHRIDLSAIFHTSRGSSNKCSKVPTPPTTGLSITSPLSPTPGGVFSDFSPSPKPYGVLSSARASSVSAGGGKRKTISSSTPRRSVQHRIFSGKRSKQRKSSGGGGGSGRKASSSWRKQQQHQQQGVVSPTEEAGLSSPDQDMHRSKTASEISERSGISINLQYPPLPPYLLRQLDKTPKSQRRLLDLIPQPPPTLPTTTTATTTTPSSVGATRIPRPNTLSTATKASVASCQSLDALYRDSTDEGTRIPTEKTETDDPDEEEGKGISPVDPVPLALWSALHTISIAPLLLNCQATAPLSSTGYPEAKKSRTAPQSATFTRVTFSPFAADEPDDAEEILGKAQSCLGRISSTLALTKPPSSSLGRSRQLTRQQWSTQRELSAPVPSSSPWQRRLNPLPPHVGYYSPPGNGSKAAATGDKNRLTGGVGGCDNGNGNANAATAACCKCACHSSSGASGVGVGGTSRHSSASQPSSPWLPVDNPVALSRDAYLKVTQDGYLNRSTVDDDDEDDDEDVDVDAVGRDETRDICAGDDVDNFDESDVDEGDERDLNLLHQRCQVFPKRTTSSSFLLDPEDQVIVLPSTGEDADMMMMMANETPSFGAGEAAEDTVTLYEEIQQQSGEPGDGSGDNQSTTLYKTVFGDKGDMRTEWRNNPPTQSPDEAMDNALMGGSLECRPDYPSYPCRRRKALRSKHKPEGLLNSLRRGTSVSEAPFGH